MDLDPYYVKLCGVPYNSKKYDFVAGTMWIARANLLIPLSKLKLEASDFEEYYSGRSDDKDKRSNDYIAEGAGCYLIMAGGYQIRDPFTSGFMYKTHEFIKKPMRKLRKCMKKLGI